jgi:predicted N-acyltransferase
MKLSDIAADVSFAVERHQQLRKPTHLQFAFADRIDLLHESAWDLLTQSHGLFMSKKYLRALEDSKIPQLEHRYALVFQERTPIAAIAMQIVDVSLHKLHAKPKASKKFPWEQLEPQLKQRALICGNLLSYQLDGIAFASGISSETKWRAVSEVLYRVRRAEKISGETNFVIVKDINIEQRAQSALLHDLSYRILETEPNMVLSLKPEWTKYDDYLAGMTSKFRSSVKQKTLKPIDESGCVVKALSVDEVEKYAQRMQELHVAVQDNADVRPLTVNNSYWVQMAQLGLNNTVVQGVFQGEHMLGFLLMTLDENSVTAGQIGFDREHAKLLPLYLRLLHSAVQVAFEKQKTSVVFGRTALEPKARMGCKPVETAMWVRHRIPLVNRLFQGAVELAHAPQAPDIDPFRKVGAQL